MNRWIKKVVTFSSLAATLALLPAGVALAQDAQPQGQQGQQGHGHHRGHRQGLLGAALKLDSLTPAQRSQLEQLATQRRAAGVPVRQANAQVLTVLAQQVEAAKVDESALAPSLAAERSAAAAEQQVDAAVLAKLHDILTPAQRGQLVDGIEARVSQARADGGKRERTGGGKLGLTDQQKTEIRANLEASRGQARPTQARGQRKAALESFRGDSFDASALAKVGKRGGREARMTEAMIPVLTPNQRATVAGHLRNRAAKESRS
ncbi:MAG TPA: Spy/CpxP family protein refolding chaperone [Polyangiaceae bacterium]|jgi:Spy/CpxP family protein refolding chaperone